MIRQDLQCWFNTLSLDDRLQVQKDLEACFGGEE